MSKDNEQAEKVKPSREGEGDRCHEPSEQVNPSPVSQRFHRRRGVPQAMGMFLSPSPALALGRIRGRRGEDMGRGVGDLTLANYNYKHCPSLWLLLWQRFYRIPQTHCGFMVLSITLGTFCKK